MIKHNLDYNNENVYIGSCCNFARRKCQHKSDCNNPSGKNYNFKLYQTIRANGGWDNWVMIKLSEYKCESKYELNLEERRVIDEYKAKLNINVPSRTKKEWREDNKEHINEKNKKYYENNKEDIIEKNKKYNENNKEEIKEKHKKYRDDNKEKINEYQKKWRENNKEQINEYKKKYRDDNKEKLNEYFKKYRDDNKEKLSEKITCECGSIVTKNNITYHYKSKKHLSFLNNIEIDQKII